MPPTCTEKGLTEGKHCSICNEILVQQTEINETDHNYIYTVTHATCTEDGYVTAICGCGSTFKENIPANGHYFEEGICIYCYEEDSDYISHTITTDKTILNLRDASDVVYITVSGDCTVVWEIDNPNIVSCKWGEWDGYTIPLIFTPISNGQTAVTIYMRGYDESITINVSVQMKESSLTIVGVGNEYTTYYSGLGKKISILHSVEYEKTEHYDSDKVYFSIEVVAELIESNVVGSDYYRIRYELYDENNVCVQTNDIYFDARYLHRMCSQTFNYFGKAGNYTLKFVDSY